MAVVKISKDDAKLQEKMALDELLTCAGFKIFNKGLEELSGYAKAQLSLDGNGYVTADKLSKLNYDLGYSAALKAVNNILEGFKDQLAEKSESSKK